MNKKLVLQNLDDILEDTCYENWDEHKDSSPLNDSIKINVIKFISLLPEWVINPHLIPQTSGDLSMLWNRLGNNITFTIDSTDKIIYSGYLHNTRICGNMSLTEDIPNDVLTVLSTILKG